MAKVIHSGQLGYYWDFSIMDIPICVICLKIRLNFPGSPIDENALHLPKL